MNKYHIGRITAKNQQKNNIMNVENNRNALNVWRTHTLTKRTK